MKKNKNKNKYTKKELTLRQGINELAQAVVEQWIVDGKPQVSYPTIWLAFLAKVQEEKNANTTSRT